MSQAPKKSVEVGAVVLRLLASVNPNAPRATQLRAVAASRGDA